MPATIKPDRVQAWTKQPTNELAEAMVVAPKAKHFKRNAVTRHASIGKSSNVAKQPFHKGRETNEGTRTDNVRDHRTETVDLPFQKTRKAGFKCSALLLCG